MNYFKDNPEKQNCEMESKNDENLNNLNNSINNNNQFFSLDIKFNEINASPTQSEASTYPPLVSSGQGFLNVTTTNIQQSTNHSMSSIAQSQLTANSPTATLNLNWPQFQTKIDDLNE